MPYKEHDRECALYSHRCILTPASKPIHIPTTELNVLDFWREIDAFQTSQKLSQGRPEYSFYDGPPFATGKPHYGHLLQGTIKVGLVPCQNTAQVSADQARTL